MGPDRRRVIEVAKAELWDVALSGRARTFPEAIRHEMTLVDSFTALLKGEYLDAATDAGLEVIEFIQRHLNENGSTDREGTSSLQRWSDAQRRARAPAVRVAAVLVHLVVVAPQELKAGTGRRFDYAGASPVGGESPRGGA